MSTATDAVVTGTYIYRLEGTPEESVIGAIMSELQAGVRPGKEKCERGMEAERTRREKYIDVLEGEIEAAQSSLTNLARLGNTIKDPEVRESARAVVKNYGTVLDLCSTIASADRRRSLITEEFLQRLARRASQRGIRDRLSEADAEAGEARKRLEAIMGTDKMLVAEFLGTRDRKRSSWTFGR